MRLATRTLAAALVAAAIPAFAGSVAAAPLSQSLALNSDAVGNVEQVQYRRGHGGHWHGGRWIGPAAAGFAAGAIIGGALSTQHYNDGYYAYGAAPYAPAPYADDGYYAYGAAPGYGPRTRWGYGAQAPSPGSSPACTADREQNSAFPSWMCR